MAKSYGTVCEKCGISYSSIMRRDGERCGDLSHASGTIKQIRAAKPCDGICRRRTNKMLKILEPSMSLMVH